MSQLGASLDLGGFDVAVVGGGVAGTMCAARLADQGRSVVVVERRGSLMWEVTRARQTTVLVDVVSELSPTAAAFFDELAETRGVAGNAVEPVLTQLAADRFLDARGVRLLFQASPVTAQWGTTDALGSLSVAVKGGLGTLRVAGCVDCSDTAVLLRRSGARVLPRPPAPHTWSLTFVDAAVDPPRDLAVAVNGASVAARVRPAFWPGECHVELTYPPAVAATGGSDGSDGTAPPELIFGRDVEQVVAELRRAVPALAGAKLAHVAEEPWRIPAYTVATNGGPLRGAGLWQDAMNGHVDAALSVSATEKLVSNLFLLGQDAADSMNRFLSARL